MGADDTEARAASILHGLGFTAEMQSKKTREFSGGWRMRIALARALFVKPTMMLLDEPTNHLDLEACVWLETYLASYDKILVIISHSQDFMNGVCTNILHMQKKKIAEYTGNFDAYVTARSQNEENQMKKYNWEQEQVRRASRSAVVLARLWGFVMSASKPVGVNSGQPCQHRRC